MALNFGMPLQERTRGRCEGIPWDERVFGYTKETTQEYGWGNDSGVCEYQICSIYWGYQNEWMVLSP